MNVRAGHVATRTDLVSEQRRQVAARLGQLSIGVAVVANGAAREDSCVADPGSRSSRMERGSSSRALRTRDLARRRTRLAWRRGARGGRASESGRCAARPVRAAAAIGLSCLRTGLHMKWRVEHGFKALARPSATQGRANRRAGCECQGSTEISVAEMEKMPSLSEEQSHSRRAKARLHCRVVGGAAVVLSPAPPKTGRGRKGSHEARALAARRMETMVPPMD